MYAMLAKECDAEQIAEELNKRATAGQAGFTLKLVQQVKTFTRNYLLQMQSTNLHCLPENYQQVLANTGEIFPPAVA